MNAQIPQKPKNPLVAVRDHLIDLADNLSIRLDNQLNPEPTLALEGVEHRKAEHRFLAQAKKIEAGLMRLTFLVEKFQVHSF